MERVKRFGVSLEEGLLKRLDAMTQRHGFPNRSQTIRHLVRSQATELQWEDNALVAGALVLVFDHHQPNLLQKSTAIQHDFQDLILSTQHVHLDHDNCLEIIALRGKARRLQELADRLISLKGIKHGELVMSTVG